MRLIASILMIPSIFVFSCRTDVREKAAEKPKNVALPKVDSISKAKSDSIDVIGKIFHQVGNDYRLKTEFSISKVKSNDHTPLMFFIKHHFEKIDSMIVKDELFRFDALEVEHGSVFQKDVFIRHWQFKDSTDVVIICTELSKDVDKYGNDTVKEPHYFFFKANDLYIVYVLAEYRRPLVNDFKKIIEDVM